MEEALREKILPSLQSDQQLCSDQASSWLRNFPENKLRIIICEIVYVIQSNLWDGWRIMRANKCVCVCRVPDNLK